MIEHRSFDGRKFTLGPAAGFRDLDACIVLQQETWGYPDLEVVPRNVFVLAQTLGGQVVSAWDEEGALAGFALAVPAHHPSTEPGDPPIPYLHSHMLAIAPAHRNCGLGRALKLWQRADALGRGITRMRWTFDPLVAKNAFFNLGRLGAKSRVYLADFYGSREGLATDRLLAEWQLDSDGTEPAVEPGMRIELSPAGEQGHTPGVQAALRERLREAFANGWTATGFEPGPGGGGNYLLSRAPILDGQQV